MPWTNLEARDEGYLVNWTGITQILRSYLHSKAALECSVLKVEKHTFGPDLHTMETDWAKVRAYKEAEIETQLQEFYTTAKASGMRPAVEILKTKVRNTAEYDAAFYQKMNGASAQTVRNLTQSVDRGETALAILTPIRDLCAEALIVGASLVSGGAAAVAIGAGATLKGAGKWEDTGNWKAGAVEVVVTGTLAVVGVKYKDSIVAQIILSKVQGALDAPKALVEGSTVQQGIASGALKMGAAPWQELAKDALGKAFSATGKWGKLTLIAQTGINYGIDKLGGAAANAAAPPGAPDAPPQKAAKQRDSAILDPATFGNDVIIKRAVQPLRNNSWLQ